MPEPDRHKVERRLISRLHRLARDWPDGYWLFSASGTLCLMRYDANGERVHRPNGGVDPTYIVADFDIPNDGGDW